MHRPARFAVLVALGCLLTACSPAPTTKPSPTSPSTTSPSATSPGTSTATTATPAPTTVAQRCSVSIDGPLETVAAGAGNTLAVGRIGRLGPDKTAVVLLHQTDGDGMCG